MEDGEAGASKNGIQVIARAAAVLRTLKESPTGLSLGQIAERVNLPRSTVQRIVGALQDERLVIATSSGGGLRLGPELHALAKSARYDIAERCRPYLNEFVQKTGETVDLSVLRGNRMIFLDQVQGTQRLRTVSAVGGVFPLTTTANGRACLALLGSEQAERLARAEWERMGVVGDFPKLRHLLEETRQTGLAFDLDDHTDGISAIGFAFRDGVGEFYTISVPVPSTRYLARRDLVISALDSLRDDLTRVLDL